MKKGLPGSDLPATPEELAALTQRLHAAETENRKLRKLTGRLRQLNRKHTTVSGNASVKIATAQKRQAETETAMAQQISVLSGKLTEAETANEKLAAQIFSLRNIKAEAENLATQLKARTNAAEKLLAENRQLKNGNGNTNPATVLADLRYFADWYFRHKNKEHWDSIDYQRLERMNALTKKPAPQTTPTKPARKETIAERNARIIGSL